MKPLDVVKLLVTRNEITPKWVTLRREIIQRYGQPLRACSTLNAIEIKTFRPSVSLDLYNQWQFLRLPRNQREFVSKEVRDEVLELLVGKSSV